MKNCKHLSRFKHTVAIGAILAAVSVSAGPAAMFGLAYTWGGGFGNGDLGLTVEVISDNEKDNVVAGAGVVYYPFAATDQFGLVLNAGYLFDHFAVMGGYDFLKEDWIIKAGYVNTVDDDGGTTTAPADTGGGNGEGTEPVPVTPTPEGEGSGLT
jgi:hypothetical protein